MTSERIVYMEPVPADVQHVIRGRLPEGFELQFRPPGTTREAAAAQATYLMVATTKVNAALLAATSGLRLIQHQGVGYDNIDLVAAKEKGVPVAICPEGTSIGVAEHVVLLILGLYRRLIEADASIRRGQWLQWELRTGSFELAGKTVGLVGFGRIGKEVAHRLRGFEVEVLYYDPIRADETTEQSYGVTSTTFDELLSRADIVSLHLPLTPDTRGLIDRAALAKMKPTALLINTARGGLIDEPSLMDALGTGVIAGVGLDVFGTEPLPEEHPIRYLPNALLTPHIAAGTVDALRTKMDACFANIVAVCEGREPANRII
jgi:phosphoglycerate dehydrogenase-like enzyme